MKKPIRHVNRKAYRRHVPVTDSQPNHKTDAES